MKLTKAFVNTIRELILSARTVVARGVNLVQVHTYFEIGRRIVEEEQQGKDRAAYGKQVIEILSSRLVGEFGRGFSESNLEYMRRFYLAYRERLRIPQSATGELTGPLNKRISSSKNAIPQSLTGELESSPEDRPFTLSWTHYVFLLSIENEDERRFYEIESTHQDWKVRELKRQFSSSLYERLALSRDKKGIHKLAKEGQTVTHPNDLLKEPLVLEFLGLEERSHFSESDLEAAIINQIERFLLEMGKGFLFEARQRRFTFDGAHYFVDLVF